MVLDPKDIEIIERIVCKNGEDIAVSISRSFERLEERMDSIESNLLNRLLEMWDAHEDAKHEASDKLGEIRKESIRESQVPF